MKVAAAGSLESNDCYITVQEHSKLVVEINSIVYDQFGDQIRKVILDTLKEQKIEKIYVQCNDKGALDYTIKARLLTAIARMRGIYA
jgi:citrate lyase subunit gamma (acyl carrier protein)